MEYKPAGLGRSRDRTGAEVTAGDRVLVYRHGDGRVVDTTPDGLRIVCDGGECVVVPAEPGGERKHATVVKRQTGGCGCAGACGACGTGRKDARAGGGALRLSPRDVLRELDLYL